jgi:hypothetical protein
MILISAICSAVQAGSEEDRIWDKVTRVVDDGGDRHVELGVVVDAIKVADREVKKRSKRRRLGLA